jgi:hypothetical protein
VHLDEGGHAERGDPLDEGDQRRLREGHDHEQDHVGARGAGLPDLVRRDDEVLAQDGDVDGGRDELEVVDRPAEAPTLGQHADDAGAAGRVLAGEGGRVGDRGDVALAGARALDLRDHLHTLVDGEGREAVARRGHALGMLLDDVQGRLGLPDGDVFPDAVEDAVQHAHVRLPHPVRSG